MKRAVFLLASVALLSAGHAPADDIANSASDPEIMGVATAAIGRQLGSADARVSGLRTGRAESCADVSMSATGWAPIPARGPSPSTPPRA